MGLPLEKNIARHPAWKLSSDRTEAWLTRTGGHLGPVRFRLNGRTIEPFALAPWTGEKFTPPLPPLLRILGGDFFCLPFGGNATPHGREIHPLHGETAQGAWKLLSHDGANHGTWVLRPKVRPGRVLKKIWLVPRQTAIYQRHEIHGMRGPISLGHHANLQFPNDEGSGRISTSPFSVGQVYPGAFENPAQGGYSALKPGARFTALARVPLATGGTADLSHYPARRGFTDLVMLISRSAGPFAWTAVTFPRQRYVWFALKNPRVLRHTILWLSNGGRHYAPWNGRHVSMMGLEEVTSYFHEGLAESVCPNALNRQGIPTSLVLRPDRPTVIDYIMAVAQIPAGFDEVRTIRPDREGVALTSVSGKKAVARVDLDFLTGSEPAPWLASPPRT
jgi:hypothetical protein